MPVIKATGSHRMTLREFSKEYMSIRTDWAHNTLKIRRDALRHCDFMDKPLIEITKMDLAKNIKRLEKKYAYNTVAAIHRLRQIEEAREQERQERIDKAKSIAWYIGDVFAWVFGIIAIVAVSTLDSEPWFIPALALGVSAIYLALYGAIRGVLG